MNRLHAEDGEHQARVEASPFFKALVAGELSLDSYVGLLRALAILYEVLEDAATRSEVSAIAGVWRDQTRRLPLLERDLAYFEMHMLHDIPEASLAALVLAEQIRLRATDDPVSLLGYLYIFYGSAAGGRKLRSHVARHFRLRDESGLAYLSSYETLPDVSGPAWQRRVLEATIHVGEQRRLVEAAGEATEGIEKIVEALYPNTSHKLRDLVSALNIEAGNYPIPDDPREIQAALRAGELSWRRFPYYEWRYGARGKRFTRSDSAWLVTLTEGSQEFVLQQIDWLGRVLATRGMPRWLLEQHLDILHRELTAALPEKSESYAKLLNASHHLRDIRRAHLGDGAFQALASAFEAKVGPDWSRRLPGAGELLVAAVVDERAGIKNAVESLESWMVDPSRFPNTWIEAVRMTIRSAQEQAT